MREGKAEAARDSTRVCREEKGTFDDTQKERSVAKAEREGRAMRILDADEKRRVCLTLEWPFGGEVREYGEREEEKKNRRREEEIDSV